MSYRILLLTAAFLCYNTARKRAHIISLDMAREFHEIAERSYYECPMMEQVHLSGTFSCPFLQNIIQKVDHNETA